MCKTHVFKLLLIKFWPQILSANEITRSVYQQHLLNPIMDHFDFLHETAPILMSEVLIETLPGVLKLVQNP